MTESGSRKKIAIFCDGSWNDLSMPEPTNVVRLARSVADRARDDSQQIIYYDEGVGVGAGVGWLTDRLTKFVGGALGRGLDRKVEAAYRFLVLNYCPGDEIYVFGFSRGAYTARSLCGMIRKCGVLRRAHLDHVDSAMNFYRSEATKGSPDAVLFRAKFSHDLATATEDLSAADAAVDPDRSVRTIADLYQYRSKNMYRLMYAGIWDTVGAMGIPEGFDIFGVNKKYAFHDLDASNLIASIRHAVAANDRRSLFDATLYANMDTGLNPRWAQANRYDIADPKSETFVPYPFRPYQQRWFPGDHGSVGGGHRDRSHSSGALLWIAEGAEWAGLKFDWENSELTRAAQEVNWSAKLGDNSTLGRPGGKRRAAGPEAIDEIGDATYLRYHSANLSYRPRNLRQAMLGSPSQRPHQKPPERFPAFPSFGVSAVGLTPVPPAPAPPAP